MKISSPCRTWVATLGLVLASLQPTLATATATATATTTVAGTVAATPAGSPSGDTFLPEHEAFRGQARIADGRTLALQWQVAPGYHLYRERFTIEDTGAGQPWGPARMPAGRLVHDPNLDEDLHYWEGQPQVEVPLAAGAPAQAGERTLRVRYQGCADAGLCYPPQEVQVRVQRGADGQLTQAVWLAAEGGQGTTEATAATTTTAPGAAAPANGPPASPNASPDSDAATGALRSGSLLAVAGVFLLAGLLLSMTPCVLPMVPILSSIIVGQGAAVSRGRGFALALAYALGMALVYTLFGVAAGLVGEGLSAALQNAWVLGAFALLLVALAASMFGLYELQLPSAVQTRLSNASQGLPGGRFGGVFLMGGLSALIVGPCVAAPLAGALVYISQTRDVLLGGLALFCLAMGMSVPLLAVGASAGALLPRAGRWMASVKTVFGVALLAVALWLVSPVLPAAVAMLLAGGLLVAAALLLAEAARPGGATPAAGAAGAALAGGAGGALRSFGLAGAVLLGLAGMAQVVGALSGGSSLVQPLRHLARASGVGGGVAGQVGGAPGQAQAATTAGLAFQPVHSLAELNATLQRAGRPVMLDVSADWCVACKELEAITFADPTVRARLGPALLLRADVTANSDDQRALLRRFGLFGPPGVLFFDRQGREQPAARVVGYQPPAQFLQRMQHLVW